MSAISSFIKPVLSWQNLILLYAYYTEQPMLGPVGQSVASLIADPGVISSILSRHHTFLKIDHEIFSAVILLLLLIQKELLSVGLDARKPVFGGLQSDQRLCYSFLESFICKLASGEIWIF